MCSRSPGRHLDNWTRLFTPYNTDEVDQKPVMLGDPRTYGLELRVDF